jgi:DNA polymerase I
MSATGASAPERGGAGTVGPVYLVDGYSIVYRSYFAFINRPLLTPGGANASAVFGFMRFLVNLLRAERPRYLAVVLDPAGPTFRHERYPEYKANRERAPQDLHAQVPVIERLLLALGVPILRVDGFEADDVMATVAARCGAEGVSCAILSGDKDILQLVDEHVYVLEPEKGAGSYSPLRAEQVEARRGVRADQMVDYLSLTGDQSDNVPGVKGIGEKTAVKLLAQWGSLDGLYAHIAEVVPPGVRKKLEEGRESALLSRELVTLRRDVPLGRGLERGLESLRLGEPDYAAAVPLLLEQGIKSIAAELAAGSPEARALSEAASPASAVSAASPETAKPGRPSAARALPAVEGDYRLVVDEAELERWVERARRARLFAYDCETDSLDELDARPVGFSLAVEEGEACYIPVRAPDAAVLPEELVRASLRRILEDPEVKVVGQNLKYDYKVARRWGIGPRGLHFDTMVAAWLLDSSATSYSLDSLAERLLGLETLPYEELIPKGDTRSLADVEVARVTRYAAEDADLALRVFRTLEPRIEAAGMGRLLAEVEMPLVALLGEMELAGIRLEPAPLERLSSELEERVSGIDREIFSLCGHEFNINSTRQLQTVLFEERNLKAAKKTQTGFSTDNSVLEVLAEEDRVAELVLDHRSLAKLKSTYVDALPGMVRKDTGRIHTHFLQIGTATGRLSSRDPNLQNIPVREETGRRIREAFVPENGRLFMSADYSQIELVVLAHLSGDPILSEAFRAGKDVHARTAALLYGLEEGDVGPQERRIGKTINFGVIYGMSAFRLARDLKIARRDAEAFIARYFETYRGVEAFIARTVEQAAKDGYVSTLMGRRRQVAGIDSRNRTERSAAERVAVNSRIQGSAADIVKKAMLDVDAALRSRGLGARILLQVHDELILEVPESEVEAVGPVVRAAMERAVELDVPLRANVDAGGSWGSIH